MRTVVITGGIGAGKSMVSALLAEKGIPVYDSDSRTKALYRGELLERIEAAFGRKFRRPDAPAVDFAALSAAAFASPESLALLESIVYPAVVVDFTAWREEQMSARGASVDTGRDDTPPAFEAEVAAPPFVVLESAIILSKPAFDGLYDTVVLVYAPEEQRISRVLARNPGLSEEAVRRRIVAQPFDFSRADYLLINDGSLSSLRSQVEALYAALDRCISEAPEQADLGVQIVFGDPAAADKEGQASGRALLNGVNEKSSL